LSELLVGDFVFRVRDLATLPKAVNRLQRVHYNAKAALVACNHKQSISEKTV
jgi:hypothetical protein